MASSVGISMFLLGLANWIEPKLDIRKWRYVYNTMIVFSISLFVIGAILGWYVLGTQISRLIPPP
jgi:Sec-independent protein secretion pathway component TatC